jgi:hypothetical protein
MSKELQELIAKAQRISVTPENQEAQRRSFAYGNTHFENPLITREMVDQAAEAMVAKSLMRSVDGDR